MDELENEMLDLDKKFRDLKIKLLATCDYVLSMHTLLDEIQAEIDATKKSKEKANASN
jgi:hypothetical protein